MGEMASFYKKLEKIAPVAGKVLWARLRFVHKLDKESDSLRVGAIDLLTGVVGEVSADTATAACGFEDSS
jgi:hypothetical protein